MPERDALAQDMGIPPITLRDVPTVDCLNLSLVVIVEEFRDGSRISNAEGLPLLLGLSSCG